MTTYWCEHRGQTARINSSFPAVGNIRFIKLCLSLSLITVLLRLYPQSLISMPAPSHLSAPKLNIEVMWKEPDAVAALHCLLSLILAPQRIRHNKKRVKKLGQKLSQRNKLSHWGQLSGKMNSLIWLELGSTVLHKAAQSIMWKSQAYWHGMIRAFHLFSAAYPFWVYTLWPSCHSPKLRLPQKNQGKVSAAICWLDWILLRLVLYWFPLTSNDFPHENLLAEEL